MALNSPCVSYLQIEDFAQIYTTMSSVSLRPIFSTHCLKKVGVGSIWGKPHCVSAIAFRSKNCAPGMCF